MEDKKNELTAEQYHALYTKAFAKLADISDQAEEAMRGAGGAPAGDGG